MTADTTAALARLEEALADQDPADLDWAREAFARLVLSGVKSSPAGGEAMRAAAQGRPGETPGTWAAAVVARWVVHHPERFVRHRLEADSLWTWRGAAWGAPLQAAGFATTFALLTLIPGWGPEPLRLGFLLLWPLIGGAAALGGAFYRTLRERTGGTVALLASVVAVVGASLLLALMSLEWLRQELDPAVPWPWLSAIVFGLVASVAWVCTSRPGRELDNEAADPGRWALAPQEPADDDAWAERFHVALRDRAVRPEREVRRDVADTRALAAESGAPLVEEFGSPWEYARTLAVDPPLVLGRRALLIAGLTLLWGAVAAGGVESALAGERSWWWAILQMAIGLGFARRAVQAVGDWRSARRG